MQDTTSAADQGSAAGPVAERMQALLSRAVQDQVSAERGVAQALAELRGQLTALAEQQGAGAGAVDAALRGLGARLDQQTGERASGSSDLARRVEELHARLDRLGAQMSAPREDPAAAATVTALAALREDVEDVGSRVADLRPQPPEAVATAVGALLPGLLAAELVPQVVDAVLARVVPAVAAEVAERVREALAAAETRTSAHVDDAVLALAEALLRPRGARPAADNTIASEAAPPPAAGSDVATPAVAARTDEDGESAEPLAPSAEALAVPSVPGQDEPGGGSVDQGGSTAPTVSTAPSGEEHGEDDDRRPWWRPGT